MTQKLSQPWKLALLGFVALAGGIISYRVFSPQVPARPEIAGFVVSQPRVLPPFTLVDDTGAPFRTADFKGAWSFVYFGYTYCPDVCPASMLVLSNVKKRLDGEDIDDAYYLVSVDPRRDTPERLGEYVHYFDPDFRGLTGPVSEIDRFTKAAGVVYEVPAQPEDDNYLVGHSSIIVLVNPDGNIQAFLSSPFDADRIASDFERIRRYFEQVSDLVPVVTP